MKMKIEFRGKSNGTIEELEEIGIEHTNGWVYGSYIDGFIINGIVEANDEYISIEQWCGVDPKTVGQYTNVNTHRGEKIFEGDYVRVRSDVHMGGLTYPAKDFYGVVDFLEGMWVVNNRVDKMIPLWSETNEIKILGNIDDNPELLEVSE
ncbi:YopX family protein [Listeria monocytogenes]|uniref:YopX family protein n=1 Tax=Listeria monocytogenes TaxID=1639 RepID=UPI001CD9DA6E|nr:YopX family protein [Listeria monocytogenes]